MICFCLLEFSISSKDSKKNKNMPLDEKVFVSLKVVIVHYPELIKNCCKIEKRHLHRKKWQKHDRRLREEDVRTAGKYVRGEGDRCSAGPDATPAGALVGREAFTVPRGEAACTLCFWACP